MLFVFFLPNQRLHIDLGILAIATLIIHVILTMKLMYLILKELLRTHYFSFVVLIQSIIFLKEGNPCLCGASMFM